MSAFSCSNQVQFLASTASKPPPFTFAVLQQVESLPDALDLTERTLDNVLFHQVRSLPNLRSHSSLTPTFPSQGGSSEQSTEPIFDDTKLIHPKLKHAKAWKFRNFRPAPTTPPSVSAASAAAPLPEADENPVWIDETTNLDSFIDENSEESPAEAFLWDICSSTSCPRLVEEINHIHATISHPNIQKVLILISK